MNEWTDRQLWSLPALELCQHPLAMRFWDSNWTWYCDGCNKRFDAPMGAVGVVDEEGKEEEE